MANRLAKWLSRHKQEHRGVLLEDVEPLHPEEYPARHLKEILDERRADLEERSSQPTGMLNGPGPLS